MGIEDVRPTQVNREELQMVDNTFMFSTYKGNLYVNIP